MKNYFWFILLLASCQSPSFKGEQCAISLLAKACICREYEYTIDHIGNTSMAVEHDIEYCDRLIGMKDYIGFSYFLEKVRLEIKDNAKMERD